MAAARVTGKKMGRQSRGTHYVERLGLEIPLLIKRLRAVIRQPSGWAAVTFVAGVQRSGTNMMMDILEQSLDTDTYHERDPRAFDNYEMRDIGKRPAATPYSVRT